jgi:hypothetical protein
VTGAIRSLNARVVGHEIVIDLQSEVLFGFAESNIRPDAAKILEKVYDIISGQKAGGPVRVGVTRIPFPTTRTTKSFRSGALNPSSNGWWGMGCLSRASVLGALAN